jgi:hypothetical protein
MRASGYEAFWIPGLNTSFDPDRALDFGWAWLDEESRRRSPLIVLNAVKMTQNRRRLAEMAQRFPVRSPQARYAPGDPPHAVLAVWPTVKTLEFAERLAWEGALCVIPNTLDDMSTWIARAQALNLTDPAAPPIAGPVLIEDARRALDGTLEFDGHNSFLGGGGKDDAIRTLRRVASMSPRPSAEDIEAHALASGKTDYDGAARLSAWYRRILQGGYFRGERGERI